MSGKKKTIFCSYCYKKYEIKNWERHTKSDQHFYNVNNTSLLNVDDHDNNILPKPIKPEILWKEAQFD